MPLVGRMLSADDYGLASMALAGVGLGSMLVIGPVLTVYGRLYVGRNGDLAAFHRSLSRDLTLAVGGALVIYLGASLFAGAAGVEQRRLLLPATFLLCAQAAAGAAVARLEAGQARRGVAVVTGTQRLAIPITLVPLVLLGVAPAAAFITSQGLACVVAIICGHWASESATKTLGVTNAPVRSAWQTAALWSPLTLGNLCMWIMTTSDRFILSWYHPLSVVGAYTLNYGLWSLPFLAVNGWLEMLTRPLVYASEERGEHGYSKILTNRRVITMLVVGTAGAVCLIFVGRSIALLLFEPEYWLGLWFILILASGHVLMGVGYAYVSVLLARHESSTIAVANLIGASANIILNLILVPRFAGIGAAVSTACAYAVWSGVLAWRVGLMSRVRSEQ